MIVTTSRKPGESTTRQAQDIAASHGLRFYPRGNKNLADLIESFTRVLVLSSERLSCHTRQGGLFFHPNMAAVRLRALRQKKGDKLLSTCRLKEGDKFLDCTAGFCSDSLVAKYGVGEGGAVIALEQSLPIYLVMKHGLASTGIKRFQGLARSIELIHADFRSHLPQLPPKSFDVVYFDPMFDLPVLKASSMLPLRPLALDRPLLPEDIAAAARVAKKRVVVKQRSSFEFSHLGLKPVGSPNRRTAYGILELEGQTT